MGLISGAKKLGRFVDPTNTSNSDGLGNVIGNADVTNRNSGIVKAVIGDADNADLVPSISEYEDAGFSAKDAKEAQKKTIAISDALKLTQGIGPAKDAVDIITGGKAADALTRSNDKALAAQEKANEKADNIALQTLNANKELIAETKEQIFEISDEIQSYADSKNIDIATALTSASNESTGILLGALQSAKDAEDEGDKLAFNEIIGGISESAKALIAGENSYAEQQLIGIKDASERFTDTRQQAQQNLAPWMDNGVWASDQLRSRADELTRKFTLDDMMVDPGYQQRLDAGQNAIINRGSAIGITGNTAKDLINYSQNAAANEVNNSYIRFRDFQNNATSYLSNISNQGKNATSQYNDIISQTNQQLAGLDREGGNVLANRDLNTASINSGRETALSDANANYYSGRAGRQAELERSAGGVRSGGITDRGNILANRYQSDRDTKTFIDTTKMNAITAASGGNINALNNYGQTSANLALSSGNNAANAFINQGNIQANKYNTQANLFGNALNSYLFLRGTGGGGLGGGGGGGTIMPNTAAFSSVA